MSDRVVYKYVLSSATHRGSVQTPSGLVWHVYEGV